jgi:hypothetical protein
MPHHGDVVKKSDRMKSEKGQGSTLTQLIAQTSQGLRRIQLQRPREAPP